MAITKVKGTYDSFDELQKKYQALEEKIRMVCHIFNYDEIKTPIMEYSELFHRTVGETSDLVKKETYDFLDRGDRSVTLRPEGTAGVVRSYIENKMYANNSISKLFYIGPMFRYERPQKGRYRQFHQFGVEAFGSSDPLMDAEVISLAVTIIKAFALKGIKVHLNSLGDEESRENYRRALVEHFSKYRETLCEDCKMRLEKNPLRILDCKVDKEKEAFKNVPNIYDYLSPSSKERFDKVISYLKAMNIDYIIDPMLVRGLDYYTHTIFEIEANIEGFGAQNIMCGGGRYDNLVSDLGGPQTPGMGFAFGLERLLAAVEASGRTLYKKRGIHLFIITLGDNAKAEGMRLLNDMRFGGLITEIDYKNGNLKQQFKASEKYDPQYIAILGEDELKNNTINLKIKATNEQHTIYLDDLYDYIVNDINNRMSNYSCGGSCSGSCDSCGCDGSCEEE